MRIDKVNQRLTGAIAAGADDEGFIRVPQDDAQYLWDLTHIVQDLVKTGVENMPQTYEQFGILSVAAKVGKPLVMIK